MEILDLSHNDYKALIEEIVEQIKATGKTYNNVYGIPRGGHYASIIISQEMGIPVVLDESEITPETLIVDDIEDSGKTLTKFSGNDTAVAVAKHKTNATYCGKVLESENWVKFPNEKENEIETHLERVLQYIGEDTGREGLLETPKRMRKAYDEIFAGYKQNPKNLFKTFTDGACKELVILKDCEFFSTCEHHFLPFFGKISIGYIPNGKVIGVSKLARLADCFAKRLQIQERLVAQIADTLVEELNPLGVIVVCEAVHFCMKSRGVKKINASMVTSAIRGEFERNIAARQEFLSLIKK